MRAAFAAAALALAASLHGPAPTAQGWETGTDGLRPIPPLSAHVTDLTQTLSAAEKGALEAKLADWEARTTNQLAVLVVPTTQPEPIEAYSLRVAENWKIGRKGHDNGALLTVAKDDRKMRIEVGYGLEGTLTDATTRRIIAENIAPYFREGRFAAGIGAGVDRIIEVVGEGKPLPPPVSQKARPAAHGFDFGTALLLLLIVVPLIGRLLRGLFGRFVGSTVGAGVVGAVTWLVAGSMAIAILAAIVGFIVMIFAGAMPLIAGRRGGVFLPGGFGGGGWSGGGGMGGGGWSGGGGTFGGGGASGGWD